MTIRDFLNNDFELLDDIKDRLFLVLFFTLYIILFLNIFVPYNIDQWAPEYTQSTAFITLTMFGLIGGTGVAISHFILRKWFNFDKLTNKTFLLWMLLELLIISNTLTLLFSDFNSIGSYFNELIFIIERAVPLAIVPYIIALLILSVFKSKTAILKSQKMISKLKKESDKVVIANELIQFPDDKNNIKLSLQLDDLLYLESTDNYVLIYFLYDGELKKELLRNSLKKLEKVFVNLPVKRCHRSYMVNLNNLSLVKKSGQKITLTLNKVPEPLPVSKTYQKDFIEYLHL